MIFLFRFVILLISILSIEDFKTQWLSSFTVWNSFALFFILLRKLCKGSFKSNRSSPICSIQCLVGLAKRLQKEFETFIPEHMLTNVVDSPERKDSSWIGGSILASLSTMYISIHVDHKSRVRGIRTRYCQKKMFLKSK